MAARDSCAPALTGTAGIAVVIFGRFALRACPVCVAVVVWVTMSHHLPVGERKRREILRTAERYCAAAGTPRPFRSSSVSGRSPGSPLDRGVVSLPESLRPQ